MIMAIVYYFSSKRSKKKRVDRFQLSFYILSEMITFRLVLQRQEDEVLL